MRNARMLIAMTVLLFVGGSTLGAPSGDRSNSKDADSWHHYPYHHYHRPPPPPPPPSKRCPCDSKGNPIDKDCGKGNDSNIP